MHIRSSDHILASDRERELTRNLLTLRIIFGALLVAQIVFAVIVLILKTSSLLSPISDVPFLFDLVLPLLVVVEIVAASFFASRRVDTIRNEPDRALRLQLYKMTLLLKWALLEGATFLTLIGLLLSDSFLYPIMAFLLLMMFIINRPNSGQLRAIVMGQNASRSAS